MNKAACLPGLFDQSTRSIADTSLDAWQRISEDLKDRERYVFQLVHRFIRETGHADVTGGELAEFAHEDKTHLRPRLTEMCRKGLLLKGPKRMSRARGESGCHGYKPALPVRAIERSP